MRLDRWEYLRAELLRWVGTPFWPRMAGGARPGVGADCVSFLERAYANGGAITAIAWPAYVTTGGGREMLERMLATLYAIPELDRIHHAGDPVPELVPGDILVISNGKALHHLAAFIGDNRVIHCTQRGGVCLGSTEESVIARHLWAVYRPRS